MQIADFILDKFLMQRIPCESKHKETGGPGGPGARENWENFAQARFGGEFSAFDHS